VIVISGTSTEYSLVYPGSHLGGEMGTTAPGDSILGAPKFCGQKFVYL